MALEGVQKRSRSEYKSDQRNSYRNSVKKRSRSSSTPGRNKGENCHASVEDRYYAKSARAYKDKSSGYCDWCNKHSGGRA